MHKHSFVAATLAIAALPIAAHAQQDTPPDTSIFDGNYLTVGVAALSIPSYEGSNDRRVTVTPIVQGRVAGIGVSPRPGGLALDLIHDPQDAKVGFSLGPVVTYSLNRHSAIKDPVVRAAGKLKSAVDAGVSAGITGHRLLDPYDALTLSVDVKWNVNSADKGMVISPTLSYATPLSKAAFVTLSASAKHVDGNYANYYYDVSPVQSLNSGLPVFGAHKSWASVGGAILGAYDLSGDLRNGGLAVVVGASYSKLLDDARNTPYTSIRGSNNQWVFGGGLAYTF